MGHTMKYHMFACVMMYVHPHDPMYVYTRVYLGLSHEQWDIPHLMTRWIRKMTRNHGGGKSELSYRQSHLEMRFVSRDPRRSTMIWVSKSSGSKGLLSVETVKDHDGSNLRDTPKVFYTCILSREARNDKKWTCPSVAKTYERQSEGDFSLMSCCSFTSQL